VHTKNIVNSLPLYSLQAWTDGSKLGKGSRGPKGAGSLIIESGTDLPLQSLKYHLGVSTNQAAELWAIGGALTTIKDEHYTNGTDIHNFLFSSVWCRLAFQL
jgi:ribonuclease HI